MMDLLGNTPFDFVMSHKEAHLERLLPFVHRTFNGYDFIQFVKSLQYMYMNYGGLETFFSENASKTSLQPAIAHFKTTFFEMEHLQRAQKHVSNPEKGSAAKRINMFLRWMVRNDTSGVDFGLGVFEGF